MSSFTPAPWKWNGHLEQAIITADSGEEVLWGCGCCDSPRLLCEADAHLITAAPDLYEACEAAVSMGDTRKVRAMLDAALKKARGEE